MDEELFWTKRKELEYRIDKTQQRKNGENFFGGN